jgi:hypothetical protein
MKEQPLAFIPDATYDNPDYYQGFDDVQASKRFLEETSEKFRLSGRIANIGTGADWPAIALEVVDYIKEKDAIIASIALFFAGKKINENLDGWLSIGRKLGGAVVGCRAVLNRSASILFAMFRYSEEKSLSLKSVKLHQYEALDGRDTDSLEVVIVDSKELIQVDCSEESLGSTIHYFRISVNEVQLVVLTRGTSVMIRRLEEDKNE